MSCITTAQNGDSVVFKVEFRSFEGGLADPTDIHLRVYNKRKKLLEEVDITADDKTSSGKYQKNYTIPNDVDDFIVYEYSGMLEGVLITAREKLIIEWVDYDED